MAQVVLSGVGQAVGGGIGRTIGSVIGQGLDRAAIASLEAPRQKGPRLEALRIQGTAEGAPIPCVLGRARVTGQLIWAARFREDRHTGGGGKAGGRTVEYGYSLSFAVGLCEGEIDGIGRIWADGRLMDLSGVSLRVHRGDELQAPDPLIEAVEDLAPAYRGTAYVVFEDLPLGAFGNRIPQLLFEVFRRARGREPGLEERLEGVCLIPGAGEFVLATEPVMRREGLTRVTPENVHPGHRTDLKVSLDMLQAQVPNLKRVSLVIGWFGDDLRAGHCLIRPGVEREDKATEPLTWSVAGLDRGSAHIISRVDGAPAYGGTPSDESVRQAVRELKARGLQVTLYPFVFMDIPPDNDLPDPDGADRQPAYPWRGRITGRTGVDAFDDIVAVFGEAEGWGLRRLALHYAAMAAETGADGLLIGSEIKGLTSTRDDAGGFPAVAALRALAGECRAVAGESVKLSYAADWSEYAGVRSDDEVRFNLDPLWADPVIDYVGIDWYPPVGDWRADEGGLDGERYAGADDPQYLASQVAGGEGFDWFYASDADREAQRRTPVVDEGHGENWVFRVKDLAGWWSHYHHERYDGLRSADSTAWAPGLKPVRLTEFGCPAVDRGGNAPNLFPDPKSDESGPPPHSTGARDDRLQRRVLTAVLEHFAANNPVSPVYGEPMLQAADVWCWDARPWPDFPARSSIWTDGAAWSTGHWLNGRLHGETRDIVDAILRRGGVEAVEIPDLPGEIQGYVIDRPMTTRQALEPLLGAMGVALAERGEGLAVVGDPLEAAALSQNDLALPDDGTLVTRDRTLDDRPATVRVRFIDGDLGYQTGSTLVRGEGGVGALDVDLPAVCREAFARRAGGVLIARNGDRLRIAPGPVAALELEAGDVIAVEGVQGLWRVVELDAADRVTILLEPVVETPSVTDQALPGVSPPSVVVGAPFFRMMELPGGQEGDPWSGCIPVVAASPWQAMQVLAGGAPDALTLRAVIAKPATVGTLMETINPGSQHRWDHGGSLLVKVEGRAPESRNDLAVLAGANALAIEGAGGWEIIQFRHAQLVGGDVWRLSGLLRGQRGTDAAMRAGAEAGATVVFLDDDLTAVSVPLDERGLPLVWRAGPRGLPGGARVSQRVWMATGVQDRPWSPAHLRKLPRSGGGFDLSWTPRSRSGGDQWEGDASPTDPMRFQIRIFRDDTVVRTLETEGVSVLYDAAMLAEDFPAGVAGAGCIAVAQWGDRYGWGVETTLAL